MSFNYTDIISNLVKFLQRIKFDSRIDLETDDLKENFYRIHGALDSEVIFGIDSECDIPNAFISLRKSNHISINAKQRFSDIIENSKRIIIFGHSIYGIDYEYYADFLEKNKDTEVVVIYHNEDGKKEFENEQHIRAWLLRVVINKEKNINRTFWKKNKCSLEDYMETLSFPDSQSRDLFEEVMKLPDKYRIVIHLFYYEDYLVREIAEILKHSESNVKVRLSRGRALLKDSLKEEWENDEW